MSNQRDPGLVAHWPFAAGCPRARGRAAEGPEPRRPAARARAPAGNGRGAVRRAGRLPGGRGPSGPRFGTRGFTVAAWVHTDARGRRRGRRRARQVRSRDADRVSSGHPDQHGRHQHGPAQLSQPALRHRQRRPGAPLGRLRAPGAGRAGRRAQGRRRHALREHAGDGRRTSAGGSGATRAIGGGSISATPSGATWSTPWPSSTARSTAASGASWARDRRSGPCRTGRPGGQVYRVTPDGRWTYCGHPGAEDATPEDVPTVGYASGKADDVFALTVYRGASTASATTAAAPSCTRAARRWSYVGPDLRILSFTVYRGGLYALINGGPVYRYEGGVRVGRTAAVPPGSTQTYGAVTSEGRLYVGTWPEGEVHRYEGGEAWTTLERVGYEREIMAMALYNGKVYVGSLPMANVWRMDDERVHVPGHARPGLGAASARLGDGRLSGQALRRHPALGPRVLDGSRTGWRHGTAPSRPAGTTWRPCATGGVLRLYVDGAAVAASTAFRPPRLRRDQRPPAHDRLRPQRVLPGAPERPAPLRPAARGGATSRRLAGR